jgi:hypothetical protein
VRPAADLLAASRAVLARIDQTLTPAAPADTPTSGPTPCRNCGTPIRFVERTWRHTLGLRDRDRDGCTTAEATA